MTGAGHGPAYAVSVRQRTRPAALKATPLKGLVRGALRALGASEADVRILVVDDAEMERWNAAVFGRHRTTNVISFPEENARGESCAAVRGDILVSAPTCLRQGRGWRTTPEGKVFFFVLHGLLHLAGFDHGRADAARRMRRREIAVYRAVTGAEPR